MKNTLTTAQRVKNYKGQNPFILEMKKFQNDYGFIPTSKIMDVEKILNSNDYINDVIDEIFNKGF